MARSPASRKTRTRAHVIADLGVNYFERFALLAGCTVERVRHDYGMDLLLRTYDTAGESEPGYVAVQLKSTDKINEILAGEFVSIQVQREDLNLWLEEWYPFVLVVYDAQADRTYWVHLQGYFATLRRSGAFRMDSYKNVRISTRNRVNPHAILAFSTMKRRVLTEQDKEI
jgi:hypothetical protein